MKTYDERCINLRLHHLPIRDYRKLDQDNLGLKLLAIARSIGVKTPPSADNDIPGLVSFLMKFYGAVTGDEISYAFELSAAGKLSKQLEHYNSFNIRILGDIMKQYQEYYRQQNKAYLQEKEKLEEEEASWQTKQPTPDEDQAVYDRVKKFAQDAGTLPPVDLWYAAFRHAEATGLIAISPAEKKKLYAHYLPVAEREAVLEEKLGNKGHKVSPVGKDAIELHAQNECRKHLLKLHLSQILNKQILTWKEAQILHA